MSNEVGLLQVSGFICCVEGKCPSSPLRLAQRFIATVLQVWCLFFLQTSMAQTIPPYGNSPPLHGSVNNGSNIDYNPTFSQALSDCVIYKTQEVPQYPNANLDGTGDDCTDYPSSKRLRYCYRYLDDPVSPGFNCFDFTYGAYSDPNPGDGSSCGGDGGSGGEGGNSGDGNANGTSDDDSPSECSPTMVGDPINAATGNKYLEQTDFHANHWLVFRRFYNSTFSVATSAMGNHWRHSYDRSLAINAATMIVMSRPDGRQVRFTKASGQWASDPNVADVLTEIDDVNGLPVSYTVFVAALRDMETYDATGRLRSVTDDTSTGISLTYSTSTTPTSIAPVPGLLLTVTDPQGRQLGFTYTSSGNVHQVTQPDGGTLIYAYDTTNGNLLSVQYPDSKTRQYAYNESSLIDDGSLPTAMTGIIDETGARYESTGYASSGFAVKTSLAGNVNATRFTRIGGNSVTVAYPLGITATMGFTKTTSGLFLLTSIDQPCSPQCGQRWNSRSYDANGYAASFTDFNGYVSAVTYNGFGLMTQEVDAKDQPTQRTINTTWDTILRVPTQRSVVNASGVTEAMVKMTYNARGQILSHCAVDPAVSGASGYVCGSATNASAGVRQTSYTYCEQAGVTARTCPIVGHVLTVDGPRIDVSDITTYTYYQTTDLSGCATLGGVCHSKGDLLQVTNALGQSTTFISYDKNGRVTRQVDANSTLTDFTYHPRGWLLTRTVRANANGSASASDATMTFDYNNVGHVKQITQPDGAYLRYTYDDAHRLTDIADNLNNTIHYTLDAAGNRTVKNTLDPSGTLTHALSRQYNQLGLFTGKLNSANSAVLTTQNPDDAPPAGVTYNDGYDRNSNAIYVVDGNGVGTEQQYDPLNRLAKTLQDHAGSGSTKDTTTQYGYDARNNLRSVTDPDNLVTNYTYDGLNNLTLLQSPDTGSRNYTYDAAGNRITQTDAKGIQSTYTYDSLNRLTGISYPTSSLNVTYAYDQDNTTTQCLISNPIGRLTTMTDSSGSTVYCYDRRGNVLSKKQAAGGVVSTTSATYTLADHVATMTYPSGAIVTRMRNTLGQITGIAYQADATATAQTLVGNTTYQPFGPLKQIVFGNGRTLTKSYDKDYAISDIVSSDPNGLALQTQVDALGNLTNASTGADSRSYGYDPLYRLNQVKDGAAATLESYSYGKTGDRLSKTLGGTTATYTYSSPLTSHRLQSAGGLARFYDANGNTTQIDATSLTYDDRNRLTQGNTATYGYNGKGQRVLKTIVSSSGSGGGGGGLSSQLPAKDKASAESTMDLFSSVTTQTTIYTYGGDGQLVGEFQATKTCRLPSGLCGLSPAIQTDYIWLNGTLVGVAIDGGAYYVEADQLGTPRIVVQPGDATSDDVVVWKWGYIGNSFGEDAPDEDPDGDGATFKFNLRFPGQYYDTETGLHYNYFRDYDPNTGRYAESDPLGLRAGLNSYRYVATNPFRYVDSYGLQIIALLAEPPILPEPLLQTLKPASELSPDLANALAREGVRLENVPRIPINPADSPGPDWMWRGAPDSNPGDEFGAWAKQNPRQSLHPDLEHEDSPGPHWDWNHEDFSEKIRIPLKDLQPDYKTLLVCPRN